MRITTDPRDPEEYQAFIENLVSAPKNRFGQIVANE